MSENPFKLSKPVQAHGEMIDTLTIAKPDGQDIINFGLPMFAQRDNSDPENPVIYEGMNMGVVAKYLAKCCAIPPSAVKQIEPADWIELGAIVCGFFTK